MTVDYTATKSAARLIPSGSAPDFAGDVNEVVQWLQAGRSFRKVATIAALTALADMDDNDIAQVDNVDGAYFKYDSSAPLWRMHGAARFADASARSTAIPSPVQGMRTTLATDPGYEWVYLGTYNNASNPQGANPAGWYPVDGAMIAQGTVYNASIQLIANSATAVSGLNAVGVAPGTPVTLVFETAIRNSASGAHRTCNVQFFEDSTGLGTVRTFGFANDTGDKGVIVTYTYTPTAGEKEWTVKLTASSASAIGYYDARLQVQAATPRA
jgi:hypothetical protein